MAVNLSGIRRNFKNVAHNYTDAQVKVREATSNDPWGPSSTMMSEIADLTYNVAAFSEIMRMVWKRLNDHGKNWRHVYKALVLLEYLIKTGSEKVAQQCKENIHAIQTLKDFQYLDDNKDQGINVREKAKALVALLKDDERLKNERIRALKAKERFAQSQAGIGSDSVFNGTRERMEAQRRMAGSGVAGGRYSSGGSPTNFEVAHSELEAARPQTVGEEELQLQLALAMSREEHEQEESKNRSDDMRLQLALQKSKEEDVKKVDKPKPSNDLLDLADLNFGNPVQQQPPPPERTSASSTVQASAWGAVPSNSKQTGNDPWGGDMITSGSDPWAPPPHNNHHSTGPSNSPIPNMGGLGAVFGGMPQNSAHSKPAGCMMRSSSYDESADDHELQLECRIPTSRTFGGSANDPWNTLESDGPSTQIRSGSAVSNDPWTTAVPLEASIDPFSPMAQNQLAEFDLMRDQMEHHLPQSEASGFRPPNSNGGSTSPDPFDLSAMNNDLIGGATTPTARTEIGLIGSYGASDGNTGARPKKSMQSLLGEHSNLVNLDNLVTSGKHPVRNPFEQQPQNPFQAVKAPKPAMNDLLQQKTASGWTTTSTQPNPSQMDLNPFF